MMAASPALMGAIAAGPRPLVRRGAVDAPALLTRAQVGSRATRLASTGGWVEVGADVPRLHGLAGRLLIEGQRANGIRNPRAEGATPGVVGAGGVLPTNWSVSNDAGLTTEVLSVGLESGVAYARLRIAGTATGTQFIMQLDTTTAVVATPSQTWTGSLFCRLVAAPQPPAGHSTRIPSRTSGGGIIATGVTALTPTSDFARHSRSLTISSDPTTARVGWEYRASTNSGAAHDWTIDIGWPQMELGHFAGTPILPSPGSLVSATRGADVIAATLGSLGIASSGAGTLLFAGMIGQAAPFDRHQTILQIDDGTAANAIALLNRADGQEIVLQRTTAGAASTAVLGTMTPGVDFRLGMAISPGGRVAASLNGGAVAVLTGGPTGGLTTVRIGNGAGGDTALFGEAASVSLHPFPLTDASLPSAVRCVAG